MSKRGRLTPKAAMPVYNLSSHGLPSSTYCYITGISCALSRLLSVSREDEMKQISDSGAARLCEHFLMCFYAIYMRICQFRKLPFILFLIVKHALIPGRWTRNWSKYEREMLAFILICEDKTSSLWLHNIYFRLDLDTGSRFLIVPLLANTYEP